MTPTNAHRGATRIGTYRHPPARRTPSARSADGNARRTDAVSVRSLLDVMADFDRFGGASLELVSWELSTEVNAVSAAWSRASAEGLLERSESDELPGEQTWRLTTRGRRAHDAF